MEKLEETTYDLIIIGAGLSGSHAAYVLKKKCPRLRILMIEGKGRVGGRTETIEKKSHVNENKTIKWDLGGQWVGKTQANITRLLSELGIETYRQFNTGTKVLELNGRVTTYGDDDDAPNTSYFSTMDMNHYVEEMKKVNAQIKAIQPYSNEKEIKHLDSINMKDYLNSKTFTSSVRSLFNSNMRGVSGLETDQMNGLYAFYYIKSCDGIGNVCGSSDGEAQESKIKGGAQQITERMLEFVEKNSDEYSFKLILNTEVVEIKQNEINENEPAVVVTRNTLTHQYRVYRATKVISSIPVNLYTNVTFEPELPLYKRNVFKFVQTGNYTKFIVTYKRTFWREKGFSGEMSTDGSVIHLTEQRFNQAYSKIMHKLSFNKRMPTMGAVVETFDATNDGEPALVGFLAANACMEWGDMTLELRREEVIEALVRYFGPEARDYTEYIEKNWAYEKFCGGCPNLNVVSSSVMKDYARATREPFINFHFCGTETATRGIGYMEGAIESGERAANEVLFAMFDGVDPSVKCDFEKTYYYQMKEICTVLEDQPKSLFSYEPGVSKMGGQLMQTLYRFSIGAGISYAIIGTLKKLYNFF